MIARLRAVYERRLFNRAARPEKLGPPLVMHGDSPAVVTQLCSRDVRAYIAAFKSFYRYVQRGTAVI